MKKKYIKIFIFALFSFFMSSVSVFAREMTIDELGEEASKIQSNAGYVYILGEYAFTSNYNISQEDIIIASTSLKLENPTDLSQAVIYQIERVRDDNFNPIGWKVGTNLLGQKEMPKKVDVKWIDMQRILEKSNATITMDIDNDENSTYKNGLKKYLNFDTKSFYGKNDNKITMNGNKVSGLLLKKSVDNIFFNEEDKKKYFDAEYFFATIVKVPKANKNTIITTTNLKGEIKESTWEQFDVQDGTPGMFILFSFNKKDWEDSDKQISIAVDIDGKDENDVYDVTEYKLDLTNLEFQEDSNAILNDDESDISTVDKQTLTNWGYTLFGSNKHYTLESNDGENSYKLLGKVEKQYLNEKTFNQNAEEGYFFVFNLKKPNNLDKILEGVQVTVTGEQTLTYGKESFNDAGVFTEIFKLKDTCSSDDCKIKIKVDWDGTNEKYLESQEITIDYHELTFVKSSKASVLSVSEGGLNSNPLESTYGWQQPKDYNVSFEKDGSTVKVKGLLPIVDSFTGGKHPFGDESTTGYYLPFVIKTDAGKKGDHKNLTVQFISEEEEPKIITAESFDGDDVLYILKHLHKDTINKTFKIVVDMDGSGEEYAPYEITIDYTDLEFQSKSLGGVDFSIIDATTLDENSEEKKELEGYQFNPETVKGVTIKTKQLGEDGSESSKIGITGSIKEQTLNNGFYNNTGYFVPIKISVSKEEEWFEKHQNAWTITLNTENGSTKIYKPTQKEYEQGWVLVLFRLNEEKNEITYKIDFDGEGPAFLPTKYTIKYDDLNFQTENKVTFEYFDETTGKVEKKEEVVYQGETVQYSLAPQFDDKNYSYHKFDYWYDKEKGASNHFDFETETTNKNQDLTLKAHWTIDADKFLDEVIIDLANPKSLNSQDFSTHFNVTKNDTTIIFEVLNSKTKISEMDNTSIPGTIAYLLQRGEIQDITLTFGGKKVVFTKGGSNFKPEIATVSLPEEIKNLKEEIQKGAKALYVDILGGEDKVNNMTLRQLATINPSFTLSIGKLDPSVQLADTTKDTYTFKFESDIAEVTDEQTLKQALISNAKTIYISQDFNVSSQIDIEREVLINGDNKTLTSTIGDNQSIFNIKNSNVTIENMILANAKPTAISVESGDLTTQNITITGENLEAGIEVNDGATLNASNMIFEKEHYNTPLVRSSKNNAKVNLTDSVGKLAIPMTEKQNIIINNSGNDSLEKDNDYIYNNYYYKPENSKIYKTEIYNYQAGGRFIAVKYNCYGDTLIPPSEITSFSKFNYEGENYELIGFSESSSNVLTDSDKLPEGVIGKDNLKITEDNKHYWAVFKVTLQDGVVKVKTNDEFKQAIKDIETKQIKSIYVENGMTIDYTNDDSFKIDNQKLSIIGPPSSKGKVILKAKKIEIGDKADDIFINRIDLQIDAQPNQESLIDVNGRKLTLWQSGLKNTSTNSVKYSIKYNNDKSVVDIRYMGIDSTGFRSEKVDTAYIYVAGKLAAGSDLYFNTFSKNDDDDKKSAIIIHGFAEDATVTKDDDGEPNIRFENNTVKTLYGIKFEKETSGQNGDIELGSATIGIEWDDSHTDFKGIGLYANPNKVTIKYINGTEVESRPEKVIGPSFKGEFVVENVDMLASVSITGLSKNGDTYSGIVSQSVDGKFYLPLTLTSNQFDDRKSKVIVTDPNGDSKEYLYSEYSENGSTPISTFFRMNILNISKNNVGTMKLDLEAIKTSKIKNGNKEYEIEVDYDGNGQSDDTYIINYNDVKTEEEIVLDAVKKTMDANNYTFTKDNLIKDGIEKFTYKLDKEKYYGLYVDKKNTQYSFRLRDVVPSHKGDIVITVEKAEEGYTCKDYTCKPVINGWKFSNFFSQVSMGSHELNLLQDVIKDTTVEIDAIKKVERDDKEAHTFIVTLNTKRLNEWLNNAYLDGQKELDENKNTSKSNNEEVQLKVVLDDNEEYLKSFDTIKTFDIVSNNHTYSNNRISVIYENIGDTKIQDPKTILGTSEKQITEEELLNFYEDCKTWHEYHTGGTIYEEK